jgi:hypothetical protein
MHGADSAAFMTAPEETPEFPASQPAGISKAKEVMPLEGACILSGNIDAPLGRERNYAAAAMTAAPSGASAKSKSSQGKRTTGPSWQANNATRATKYGRISSVDSNDEADEWTIL